jgi:hypothetical protein
MRATPGCEANAYPFHSSVTASVRTAGRGSPSRRHAQTWGYLTTNRRARSASVPTWTRRFTTAQTAQTCPETLATRATLRYAVWVSKAVPLKQQFLFLQRSSSQTVCCAGWGGGHSAKDCNERNACSAHFRHCLCGDVIVTLFSNESMRSARRGGSATRRQRRAPTLVGVGCHRARPHPAGQSRTRDTTSRAPKPRSARAASSTYVPPMSSSTGEAF